MVKERGGSDLERGDGNVEDGVKAVGVPLVVVHLRVDELACGGSEFPAALHKDASGAGTVELRLVPA